MDKWDELTQRIQNSILAEEPEAATSAAFQFAAEIGRQMDRIATAFEKLLGPDSDPEYPDELEHDESQPEFDL